MENNTNYNNGLSKTLNPTPLPYPQNPHLRIADILAEEEEEEYGRCETPGNFDMNGAGDRQRDGFTGRQCSSARRIIARCLAALWPARERKLFIGNEKREERVGELGGGSVATTCSINVPNGGDSPVLAPESENSGEVLVFYDIN